MLGIGAQLKEVREKNGFTLEQVQRSTKIHVEYLRALENDQFELLPSPFYVRAFLRTYAHSLGLDAAPLLDRYERLVSGSTGGGQPSGKKRAGQHPYQNRQQMGRRNVSQPSQPTTPTGMDQSFNQAAPQTPKQSMEGTSRHRTIPHQTNPQQSAVGKHSQTLTNPRQSSKLESIPEKKRETQSEAPKQENLEQTFTPRKVSLEVKKGREEEKGKSKKSGTRKWLVRIAAVGALVLLSGGAYIVVTNENTTTQSADSGKEQSDKKGVDSAGNNAQADALDAPKLKVVESGEDLEGDLYALEDAEKLKVQIKATKGDTNIRFGKKPNEVDESYEIKVGQQRTLPYDKFVWFRLTKPSNAQIKVNDQEIDTKAQDVPRSYRITVK